MLITLAIFILIISIYLFSTFYEVVFLNNAPFISSSNKKIKSALEEILQLEGLKNVYELGCGEAKFLRKLKKKKPELVCIGLEYNLIPYTLAKIKNLFLKNKLIIKKADIFNYDLSQADLIYCFLNPKSMQTLEPIIKKLNKLILVSNTFSLPQTKAYKQINFKNSSIFFYKIMASPSNHFMIK